MTAGPHLVTVAHGTRTTAGNQVAAEITAAAGRLLGCRATASYVELCAPLVADVVRAARQPTVLVPLLLSTGHHLRHDLPTAVAGTSRTDLVRLAGSLGPDPLLAAAQVDRLLDAGARPGQPVVLVAAGSSDAAALDDLDSAAHLLAHAWDAPVRVATMAGLGPRPAEVVRPGDAVAPYLMATGHFHRLARDAARGAGATVVADVIGAHPRVVDLVCERYRLDPLSRRSAAAAAGAGRLPV